MRPFVSGRKNAAVTKYMTVKPASTKNTVPSSFVAEHHHGNMVAIPAEMPWFMIIAIAMPLARMRVGISSVSASHTHTPGPTA